MAGAQAPIFNRHFYLKSPHFSFFAHERISNNSAWVQAAWRLLPPARGDVRCNEVRLERAYGGHHDDPDCRDLLGDVQVQPRRLLGKHSYYFTYIKCNQRK